MCYGQYIAAGLPVLASDVEGVGGFVRKEGVGLVFDEREPESIATAISECFADPERYDELVRQALTTADQYSWANQERVFVGRVVGDAA